MRRAGPILIVLIGVFALLVDFFPGLAVPDSQSADGSWRPIVTKLGLDLEGGLRVEYQALPVEGKVPGSGDMAIIKDIDFGMRDCGSPVIWFSTYTSEGSGALQIISGDGISSFVQEAGCRSIRDLEGKPCWVDVDQCTIRFVRHWKAR